MKKKIIVLFAAVVLTVCMLFAGCGSKNGEPAASETFEGTVSTATYSTKQEAASDYIAKEISGDDYQVAMTSYVKQADLTEEEIDSLNVADEIDGTINSVEKVKVYFAEVSASGISAAEAASSEGLSVTVYIIEFTREGSSVSVYKYYIPLPENDEVLSLSYYNSVMSAENFKNCTITNTVTTKLAMQGRTESSTVSSSIYISETAVKMTMQLPLTTVGTTEATIYIVDTQNGVKCAVEALGSCTVMSANGLGLDISSISEIYAANLNEAQCSLFVKTDYGFSMREEAIKEVLDATFDSMFSEMGLGSLTWTTDTASCDYKVVEGKLYKATADLSVTAVYGSVSMSVSSKSEVVYTNYGTTTVTISANAKSALGIA